MMQADPTFVDQLVDGLNGLSETFDTTLMRTVVTVAALGVLAGIGW